MHQLREAGGEIDTKRLASMGQVTCDAYPRGLGVGS